MYTNLYTAYKKKLTKPAVVRWAVTCGEAD